MSEDPDSKSALRIGATALGLLAGLAGGLVLAVLLLCLRIEVSFPLFVFGGAALGAMTGYLSTDAGFGLAGSVAHFVVGLVCSTDDRPVYPDRDASKWLKTMLWLGLAVGLLISWFVW